VPARKPPEPEPELDPEAGYLTLLDAVRRWRLADEANTATRAELDEARRSVVEAMHAVGIKGFSL
jgi:hypothetical protein